MEALAVKTMTVHDRCDRCGAQAYTRVTFEFGDLTFCNHHADKYAPAMVGKVLTTHRVAMSA